MGNSPVGNMLGLAIGVGLAGYALRELNSLENKKYPHSKCRYCGRREKKITMKTTGHVYCSHCNRRLL